MPTQRSDLQKLAGALSGILAAAVLAPEHYLAAQKISAMIALMTAEQRSRMTDAEWGVLFRDDDVAKAALQEWLDANRSAG